MELICINHLIRIYNSGYLRWMDAYAQSTEIKTKNENDAFVRVGRLVCDDLSPSQKNYYEL